jgi:hypothetical protein
MFEQSLSAPSCDECAPCCGPSCCYRWYARGAGLIMTRDHANRWWTTFENNVPFNQMLTPPDANWNGGFEVTLGRQFGCDCRNALEVTYWWIDPFQEEAIANRTVVNTLGTPIDLGNVTIGPNTAAFYFDNAQQHRVRRDDEIHNVELNWVYDAMPGGDCFGGFGLSLLAGPRYLRFDESITFSSVIDGSFFGNNLGADEAHLDIRDENNFIGFQIGAVAQLQLTRCVKLVAVPKIGLYANDIHQRVSLTSGDGLVGLASPIGGPAQSFPLDSSKTDVSTLAQLDLSLNYDVNDRWSAYAGYRLVAVTGVALADEQIPPFLVDYPAINDVDSNGHLLLHGAFAGVEYRF